MIRPEWPLDPADLHSADLTRLPARIRALLGNGYLPTPRHSLTPSDGSTITDIIGGPPGPALLERILGLPAGYSDPRNPMVITRRAPTGALRVVSVCSGIGVALYGAVLAAHDRNVAIDVVAAVECWAFARSLHAIRYPDTPIYGNIRCPWTRRMLASHGPVDLLLLTLPCTPFSGANRTKKRGDLHPEYVEVGPILDAVPARTIVYETVEGITRKDVVQHLLDVIEAMESRGYVVEMRVVRASEFGAVHHRARVILVAHQRDLEPVVYDLTTDPIPVALTEQEWLRDPLLDALFVPTADKAEQARSMALGGGVAVPVARAAARHAIGLLLGR